MSDVIGIVKSVGVDQININDVSYQVAPNAARFLSGYREGQQVYANIKNGQVSFLQDYARYMENQANKPQRGGGYQPRHVPVPNNIPQPPVVQQVDKSASPFSMRDEMDMMKSAAACATGIIKSMIESQYFTSGEIGKILPLMNQLMHGIYEDEKALVRGNDEEKKE